jgi:type II secretory pathway component PulF
MRLEDLSGIAIIFVVVAIVLGIGATVLDNVQDTQTSGTYAYNATEEGLEALDEFAGWQTTLAVIVVAAVVIGVIGFFWQRGR